MRLIMGVPGAGKTRVAVPLAEQGWLRLNRDERGGSLRQLAADLDDALAAGHRRVVLDNTWLTRAARSHALDAAHRHRSRTGQPVTVRCQWLDVPLAEAQVNLVTRLLDRFGALPSPDDLAAAARREPGLLSPTSQMRAHRQLEPPSADEGFATVERIPFERVPTGPPSARPALIVLADALTRADGPHAVLDALRPPGRPGTVRHADRGAGAPGGPGPATAPWPVPVLLIGWLPGANPSLPADVALAEPMARLAAVLTTGGWKPMPAAGPRLSLLRDRKLSDGPGLSLLRDRDLGTGRVPEGWPLGAGAVAVVIDPRVCPHPGGPPRCWCRPPLPGLAVAFAREHGVDLDRSVVVGTGPAHRTMAAALGARAVIV